MEKILLAMFLSISLQIMCMENDEISYPATPGISNLEKVAEDCACYVAQLTKSPTQSLRLEDSNDAILCCILHENSHIPWKIELLMDENANIKEPQGICLVSHFSSPDKLQKISNDLLKSYKDVLARLKRNWVRTKNQLPNHVTIVKNRNLLKHEPLLISTLIEKYNLSANSAVELHLHSANGVRWPNLVIKDYYETTFNYIFGFESDIKVNLNIKEII